jgi:hypothetical protein
VKIWQLTSLFFFAHIRCTQERCYCPDSAYVCVQFLTCLGFSSHIRSLPIETVYATLPVFVDRPSQRKFVVKAKGIHYHPAVLRCLFQHLFCLPGAHSSLVLVFVHEEETSNSCVDRRRCIDLRPIFDFLCLTQSEDTMHALFQHVVATLAPSIA